MYKPDDISGLAKLKLNEEQAMVITNLDDHFAGVSEKVKKRIVDNKLGLKPWKQKQIQEIEIKRIITPQAFHRLDHKDDFNDLESIEKLDRIKVSALKNEDYFILIDGFRRFQYQSEKGLSRIECEIIGIAECRSQASAARANVMSIFTKPLTTVELSYGFYELGNELENEFGESHFFKHGGNRKKSIKDKASIVPYMATLVSMKEWAVQALNKFGKELGPYALMGLQNHDHLKDLNLSIRTIQKLNGPLAESDVRKKINKKVEELIALEKDDEEIAHEAGKIVYQFIKKEFNKSEEKEDHKTPEDPKEENKQKNSAINKVKSSINSAISELKSFKELIPEDGNITETVKNDLMSQRNELEKIWSELNMSLDDILR